MTYYTELKRLADAAKNWGGEVGEDRWCTADCFKRPYFSVPDAEFIAACDPGNIRVNILNDPLAQLMIKKGEQIDQLKAENAGLKTGYEAYERVNAELKAENEALRKAIADIDGALEREYWSEYAGLEETRAILDAAMSKAVQS